VILPIRVLDWTAMEKHPTLAGRELTIAIDLYMLNPDTDDLRARVFLLSGYVWGALARLEDEKAAT
jgi:hypothetical protein